MAPEDASRRARDEIRQVIEIAADREAKGKREGILEGKREGGLEGRTAALLGVLAARGVPVSAEARARIESCRDVGTLDGWIAWSVTAASVDEVITTPIRESA